MNDSLPGFETEIPPHSLEITETLWGIDPSSKRIAVGILPPSPPNVAHLVWDITSLPQPPQRGSKFAGGLEEQVAFFKQWAESFPPARVYVEEPFIPRERSREPTHVYMFGVTLAALGVACPLAAVELIGATSWKASAMGQGNGHAKPEAYLEWARTVGYTGSMFDEAAAIGVVTGAAVREAAKRPIPA